MDNPVEVRIPDSKTALNCLNTLFNIHIFDTQDEKRFREDVVHSLKILQRNPILSNPHMTIEISDKIDLLINRVEQLLEGVG